MAALSLCIAIMTVLRLPAVPLWGQPMPDAAEYALSARSLARGGPYVFTLDGRRARPQYPPGFPAALVPFEWAHLGVQTGARLFAVALVVLTWAAALLLAGRSAALIAGLLLALTPFTASMGTVVMSDALGAVIAVGALCLLCTQCRRRYTMAGLIAGFGVLIRFSGVAVLVALLFAARNRKDRMRAAAGAMPGLATLGLYNTTAFGAPWRQGYSTSGLFSVGHAFARSLGGDGTFYDKTWFSIGRWTVPSGPHIGIPNVLLYLEVLVGRYWVFMPPLVILFAGMAVWARRDTEVARYGVGLLLASLAVFVPYAFQSGRFMAAPAMVAEAFAAAGISHLITWMVEAHRGQEADPSAEANPAAASA